MRHANAGRKFDRDGSSRAAMFKNLVANLFAKALVAPLDLFDDESVREQLQHLRANPEVRGVGVWRVEFDRPVVEYVPPRGLHIVRPENDAEAYESVQDDLIVVVHAVEEEHPLLESGQQTVDLRAVERLARRRGRPLEAVEHAGLVTGGLFVVPRQHPRPACPQGFGRHQTRAAKPEYGNRLA
jgi:hypothetical protein